MVLPCWSSVLRVRPRISKRLYFGTFQKPAKLFTEQNPSVGNSQYMCLLSVFGLFFLPLFIRSSLSGIIYLFSCGSCTPSSDGSPMEEELCRVPNTRVSDTEVFSKSS